MDLQNVVFEFYQALTEVHTYMSRLNLLIVNNVYRWKTKLNAPVADQNNLQLTRKDLDLVKLLLEVYY